MADLKKKIEILQRRIDELENQNRLLENGDQNLNAHHYCGIDQTSNQKFMATEQQLRASNQQLMATEQQLRASNQQLEASNQQLKATTDMLRQSEELYRATFEQTAVGIARVGPDGKWLEINQKLCNVVGYSRDELLMKTFQDITHPDDLDVDLAFLSQMLDDKIQNYSMEKRYFRKDGGIIWINLTVGAVRKSDRSINYFISVIEDISDRKRAEEERRKSDERFRIAQEMSPDGFTILRPVRDDQDRVIDFTWVYENDAVARMNGTDPQKIVGQRLLELFPEHQGTQFFNAYKQVVETGKPINFEDKYVGATITKPTWFRIVVVPMVENIAILNQDITERKKAEDELRSSEERFRVLFDNAPLPYQSLDEDGYFKEVNLRWLNLLGYHRDEVIGKSFADFLHPDWTDHFKENFPKFKSIGEILGVEFEIRKKDGSYLWISFDGKIRHDDEGAFVQTHCVFNDITNQKRLEKQIKTQQKALNQAQKMESIGTLAGGIAHEFNNILSIIIGNNELIMEDLPEWSISRESCEEIRLAGLRARDIVKHLLTFSRQDDSTKKPIDTRSVVSESLKLNRSTIPTNIEIRDALSPDCLPILGDATQINQILINLCSNAVDVLPISGGRIDIELCNSDINQDDFHSKVKLPPGKYVKLLVRDNGTGMDTKTTERVFEPYFTTKDVGKGSGIGLAVVHGIIENHGGSIICESAKGEGTTFTILIPAHEGPVEDEQEQKNALPGKGECVLYVDDEPSIAKLGKRHLEALGYDAFSTTDPKEALGMVKAEPDRFNLVISDMAMPNMPGDQLISKILSINPDMPTMICSGYSSRMSETKASEMGIKAFVMKPLNKNELAKKVREVLDSSKKS